MVEPSGSEGNLRLPWRWVAITSIVINLALLVGLISTIAVPNTQALSTVALTVAILAFLVQMIVFFLQSWMSNQQMLRAEQLHSDSQQLLTRVQASSDQSLHVLEDQLRPLLSTTVRDTFRETKEAPAPGAAAFEQRLVQNIQDALVPRLATLSGQPARPPAIRPDLFLSGSDDELSELDTDPFGTAHRQTDEDRQKLAHLQDYPSEDEAGRLQHRLNELGSDARKYLRGFAKDLVTSYSTGMAPGLYVRTPVGHSIQELIDAGLVEVGDRSGHAYATTTEAGSEISRMLVATPHP